MAGSVLPRFVWGGNMDMARVLAAGILAGASIVFSGSVVAAPGDPDPTFGAGGQVVLKRGGTLFENEGFALQADGKLLVPYEGRGLNGGQASGLVRYNANGTVDTAFGIQGQAPSNGVTVAASGGMIFVTARRPDGGGTFDYVGVSRFTSAGVLDAAFGVNGSTPQFMASAPLGTGDTQHLTSIAVAPDGKIVAAGVARNADNFFEVLVVRFNMRPKPLLCWRMALWSYRVPGDWTRATPAMLRSSLLLACWILDSQLEACTPFLTGGTVWAWLSMARAWWLHVTSRPPPVVFMSSGWPGQARWMPVSIPR
jgi:uncharacterized delta-60 repeat protein